MINDTHRQRRLRRLLPAAVAAVTLASSAPFLAPGVARADVPHRPERREHVKPVNPGKIPTTLRVDATRGVRVQPTAAT